MSPHLPRLTGTNDTGRATSSRWSSRLTATAIGIATATALLCGSGCASDCPQIKLDYEQALATEDPFAEIAGSQDAPIHFGVAVREELLNDVVDRALRTGLEEALALSDSVSIGGKKAIKIRTSGAVANVGLYPDRACDNCLRVDGQLDGTLTLDTGVLGEQNVPLAGSFSIVAPIDIEKTEGGNAAVRLDLSKAAELARSHVRPEAQRLPRTWWKLIQSPLGKMLTDRITKDLGPIKLFELRPFDLGVEGLQVVPVKVISDAKRGVVFAGFTTNLAAPQAGLAARTDLGKDDDVAVGVDARVLPALTTALFKSGAVSRSWSKKGAPSKSGPIYVTNPTISATAGDQGAINHALAFRAWNLPTSGKCWWADAELGGTVSMSEGAKTEVTFDRADLKQSSLSGVFKAIADWKVSKFGQRSGESITKSLDLGAVDFPGGNKVEFQKAHAEIDGDALWVLGAAKTAE